MRALSEQKANTQKWLFKVPFFFVCMLVVFTPADASIADEIDAAKVVSVHDGDTITVLDANMASYKVRLAEIDAPETKQPYGQKAKLKLSDLVFDKVVTVTSKSKDRYGRLIGYVSLDGRDINKEMLEQGAAWVYRKYSQSEVYLKAEASAKEKRIGIWSLQDAEILPPWEWRQLQKQIRDSKKRKELTKSDERKTGTD